MADFCVPLLVPSCGVPFSTPRNSLVARLEIELISNDPLVKAAKGIFMTELNQTINRLAHLPPSANPVISCFVNTGPDGRGRPTFMTFLKKAFAERLRSFPERTEAVHRIEADRDRILSFLSDELDPSVKAASIHASDGDGLWEAHTFRAEFDEERLVV